MIKDTIEKKLVPIICVYDNLIGYKNLHIAENKAVAVRGFSNSIKYMLESGEINDVSPADLSLYYVGDFDMCTGDIKTIPPALLVAGTSVIAEWHNSKLDTPHRQEVTKVGE